MADAETVLVQPLTSYHDEGEVKHATSPPYRVRRPHAQDLAGNGFARLVEVAAASFDGVPDADGVAAGVLARDESGSDRARGRRARD